MSLPKKIFLDPAPKCVQLSLADSSEVQAEKEHVSDALKTIMMN